MEQLRFEFPAGPPAATRALVGVVGSGDLEVLVEPGAGGVTTVEITTSVNGYARVWDAQLARVFAAQPRASMQIRIHDFGATPGVVGMRLAEAFEALDAHGQEERP